MSMRVAGAVYCIISALAIGFPEHCSLAAEPPSPPVAERRPVTAHHHGIRLTDDYAWLRTADPEEVVEEPTALEAPIRAYLDAENAYARSMLAPNRALERRLAVEMRGRLSRRDKTVAEAWGAWEYFTRYPIGAQRNVHCRRPRGGGPEQVLLDENVLARGRPAFSVSGVFVSPDHNLLAYSVDEDGSERDVVKVRDLATGRDLADTIAEIRGDVVWSRDSQWLFYVGRDPVKWGQKVYRHKLGTHSVADPRVYVECGAACSVSPQVSLSHRFLVTESAAFSISDIRLLDLARPTTTPHRVVERKTGNKYSVTNVGERLIVRTNA